MPPNGLLRLLFTGWPLGTAGFGGPVLTLGARSMRDGLRFWSVIAVRRVCHDELIDFANALASQKGHRAEERRSISCT